MNVYDHWILLNNINDNIDKGKGLKIVLKGVKY